MCKNTVLPENLLPHLVLSHYAFSHVFNLCLSYFATLDLQLFQLPWLYFHLSTHYNVTFLGSSLAKLLQKHEKSNLSKCFLLKSSCPQPFWHQDWFRRRVFRGGRRWFRKSCKRWGAANEALLACSLLTCCAAWFLTGRWTVLVLCPGAGDTPAQKDLY